MARRRGRASGFTFTTWKHHTRDSLLPESGLLGPVMLRVAERVTIK
jgi:hypothetical protein